MGNINIDSSACWVGEEDEEEINGVMCTAKRKGVEMEKKASIRETLALS